MTEYELTGYASFDLALRVTLEVIRGKDKKKLRRKSDIVFASSPPASIPFQISLVPYEIGKNPRALAEWIIKSEKEPINSVSGFLSPSENQFSPMSWGESSPLREQLGFNAAKLNLLLCQHSAFQSEPWKSQFLLDFEYISKRLFRKRLTEEIKAEIYANLAALSSIWVKAVWVEDGIDSSFEVTNLWRVRMRDNDVIIYPGYWTERFLNEKGEEAKTALYEIGRLSKSALDLAPKYHFILRLEVFFEFSSPNEYKTFNLIELLDCVSKRHIKKMKQVGWDKREIQRALNNLGAARTYLTKAGYKFGDIPELPPSKLKPDQLIEFLESHQIEIRSPPPDPEIVWGYEIARIRKDSGLTREQFAQKLQISPETLKKREELNQFEDESSIVEKIRELENRYKN